MSPTALPVHEKFPGGSKNRVNRAGENVRDGVATLQDLQVIEEWRAAHRAVLNTFQAILRTRTRGYPVTVAQRHKRRNTIIDKLRRIPGMQLARMDDVAGCRLIFQDIKQLTAFRSDFHRASFNHRRRNDLNKYDYISNPKPSGYRGIHDIYEYNVKSKRGAILKGLNVEIQYRTLIQHAWATANEVIGFVTDSQPKFERGDHRYAEAMSLASEILSRCHEKCHGPHPELSDRDLVSDFVTKERSVNLLFTLKGITSIETETNSKKNSILICDDKGTLMVKSYREATEALENLFELESQHPTWDIVLVRADKSEDVRLAFKNYFSDASEFVTLVEESCASLATSPKRRRI